MEWMAVPFYDADHNVWRRSCYLDASKRDFLSPLDKSRYPGGERNCRFCGKTLQSKKVWQPTTCKVGVSCREPRHRERTEQGDSGRRGACVGVPEIVCHLGDPHWKSRQIRLSRADRRDFQAPPRAGLLLVPANRYCASTRSSSTTCVTPTVSRASIIARSCSSTEWTTPRSVTVPFFVFTLMERAFT